MATALPAQSRQSRALRSTAGWPTQSKAHVTPPSGKSAPAADSRSAGTSSRTAAAASPALASTKWVAPNCRPERLLGRHRVDGHDPGRARDAQTLNDVEADAADAEDRRRVAGLHLGPVEDGTDAGQHAAADEAGRRQRDVLGDADGLHLADDR